MMHQELNAFALEPVCDLKPRLTFDWVLKIHMLCVKNAVRFSF